MKNRLIIVVTGVLGILAGVVLGHFLSNKAEPETATTSPTTAASQEVEYWVAPMDPDFRRDEPGKSPMGMDLVPVYSQGSDAGSVVSIDPRIQQNLGVRTELAEVRPLWRRIEATGYFGFDETRLSQVNLRTEGWIQSLGVDSEGERVRKGDLLFEFYSPQLVNAQKEYLQARSRTDKRMMEAASGKLSALGMVPADISSLAKRGTASETIRVLAPQDGILVELMVTEGMFVRPENEVMSFADLSSIWLQAEVFESQADWVARGQSAEARLSYMPGEVFSGVVDYVYPVLDPQTRTLRVRLRFDNPGERLKPNMYASVSIFGKTHQAALSVPREAIIRNPLHDRVVVALGEGKFQVHEVMTGIESGDRIEIIAGINRGDLVVTSAQFLIDSEASLTGSVLRLGEVNLPGEPSSGKTIFGSGRVEAVDLSRRRIRMTHGPIEDLGWPSMTMEFDVEDRVEIDNIRLGQSIHFSIHANEEGSYVIDMIHLADPAGERSDD